MRVVFAGKPEIKEWRGMPGWLFMNTKDPLVIELMKIVRTPGITGKVAFTYVLPTNAGCAYGKLLAEADAGDRPPVQTIAVKGKETLIDISQELLKSLGEECGFDITFHEKGLWWRNLKVKIRRLFMQRKDLETLKY